MPAPQQNSVPVFKETASIPRPQTAHFLHREGRFPGDALSRLLGVLPEASQKVGQEQEPSRAEQEQLAALASMGAERDRLRLARGDRVFGILKGRESTMDGYDLNRGRRDADLFAGELRDAYAESGLADNDDPAAFKAFADKYRNDIFETRLKGVSPSYQHGYITRIGSVFEDMAKAHAGNLDGFISSRSKRAMQSRIDQKVSLELSADRERGAIGLFMDSIMGAESGGNYNAFHNNGNNTRVRFTDMTIAQVMAWQDSGEWKRLGGESSAVGKYQFIGSTLRDTVRASGIDPNTRFTPAVQDRLIYHRLMTHRRMEDFLKGEMTAEDFLDNHLIKEFAGLKGTDGRGHYDGDGVNKASHSASKTIASLLALRDAYIQDPKGLVKRDKKGKLVIDPMEAGEDNPQATVAADIETADAEYGVSQPEVRQAVTDALIGAMIANPNHAARDDLEDLMASWRLPRGERERVFEARDTIRERQETSRRVQVRREESGKADLAEKFLSGDEDVAEEIRNLDSDLFDRLMELEADPREPLTPEQLDDVFLKDVDFDAPDFQQAALRAYTEGFIDRASYQKVLQQFRMHHDAKTVFEMPGVKAFVDNLEATLPPTLKDVYRDQLRLVVADLKAANGGERPPFRSVLEEAQQLHTLLQTQAEQERQRIMDKYK